MIIRTEQEIKAKEFHQLHHTDKMLILPNIWDVLGSVLLESLTYPAIATASASIAFTNGFNDGENYPFSDFLTRLKEIVKSVDIPVTADIESGYAANDKELESNIKKLIATGIVGINIEDTDKETNVMIPIEIQANKISLIRKIATDMGISLFINARTDVYIHENKFRTAEAQLTEAIKRGAAYKNAGADCFYPIVMREENAIKTLVEQLQMPINILTLPGIPELNVLNEMGVKRVSLGPSFLKIAIKAMKDLAIKLKNHEGLSDITGNEVTSDYLKSLIKKNPPSK